MVGGQSLITDYWSLTTEDRLTYARRLVAERCIYGVDKNPLAVEIAKLSLWLVTLARDLPFTFVDHALKCGDSLVGASADDFERWAHVIQGSTMLLWKDEVLKNLGTARQKRKELEGFVVRDVQDAQRKLELLREAEAATERVWRGADLMTGARLLGLKAQELESLLDKLAMDYGAGQLFGSIDPAKHYDAARALAAAQKERAFHWEFAFPEVFERGGFSAFVGNPPFIGGLRISSRLGDNYLSYIRNNYDNSGGTSDLCAYFLQVAYIKVRLHGTLGFITTNTIAQGDTRLTGLNTVTDKKGVIYMANSSMPWPGSAAVAVSVVHISKGTFDGEKILDGQLVENISTLLDNTDLEWKPATLSQNLGGSFQGSIALGDGFLLSPDEANALIEKDPKNSDVLFSYINGDDFYSHPEQKPSRWAIYFFDWSIEKSRTYEDCFKIVQEKVYPVRKDNKDKQRREIWWRFTRPTIELYRAIEPLSRVLAVGFTSKTIAFDFLPKGMIYTNALVVFAFDKAAYLALLQSCFHQEWAMKFGSTLETRLRYTPTDVFETFPFPRNLSGLEQIGETYHETRREIMLARQEGLTKVYNRFHDPEEHSEDIVRLRGLHVEMDAAVAAAYGWGSDQSSVAQSSTGQGLELGHDFHETAQGIRFTISEAARREVLSRLLKLNHERWEEEQASGKLEVESGKKTGKTGKSKNRNTDDGQIGMF